MPRISLRIADGDLAAIDAFAEPNRTAFMVRSALDRVTELRRERLHDEIAACLAETADDDLALAAEFASTLTDGL